MTSGQISNGDPARGSHLYHNCSFCHGKAGEGNYNQNAPRLAGQNGNYLRRQLQHFQQGIRGAHPQDLFGKQMVMMSRLLQTPEALDDLLAYIATLPGDNQTALAKQVSVQDQTRQQK